MPSTVMHEEFASISKNSEGSGFASVHEAVQALEQAISAADVETASKLLHDVWRAKIASPAMSSTVLTRDKFIRQIRARQAGRRDYASTSIHLCFGNLAVARADNFQHSTAIFYLLLRDHDGHWRFVGEASAGADVGVRAQRFMRHSEEASVLDVMAEYYRGVTEGDVQAIARIFSNFWEMKNHENAAIVTEDKSAFLDRIAPGRHPKYWEDRQVADVQIVYGRLAYVRVEKPSVLATTIFLLMKLDGQWSVIDKVWADGRVEAADRGTA